jgi:GTPase involved in cell partitioning and DNA repair
MGTAVTEKRLSNIELAIKELTILNKNQEANANRQADAIDKILEHLQGMAVLEHVVEGNSEDIDKIKAKVDDIQTEISHTNKELQKEIADNKEDNKSRDNEHLVRSIIYSSLITTFLFGYLYLDFHRNSDNELRSVSKIADELKNNSRNLYHLQETVKECKEDHREISKKIDTIKRN